MTVERRRFLIISLSIFFLALTTGSLLAEQASDAYGMVVQTGHSDSVESISAGTDPRLVLSASRDGTARLWDLWRNASRGGRATPIGPLELSTRSLTGTTSRLDSPFPCPGTSLSVTRGTGHH